MGVCVCVWLNLFISKQRGQRTFVTLFRVFITGRRFTPWHWSSTLGGRSHEFFYIHRVFSCRRTKEEDVVAWTAGLHQDLFQLETHKRSVTGVCSSRTAATWDILFGLASPHWISHTKTRAVGKLYVCVDCSEIPGKTLSWNLGSFKGLVWFGSDIRAGTWLWVLFWTPDRGCIPPLSRG